MIIEKIEIRIFKNEDQEQIDLLMEQIQEEFNEPILNSSSKKISDLALSNGRFFWVANINQMIIGTVGILKINDNTGILKSMFVSKQYRGIHWGISKKLLDVAKLWATENNLSELLLGTMDQFKSAQKFYVKNGFIEILKHQLPTEFELNPLDNKFYKLNFQQPELNSMTANF